MAKLGDGVGIRIYKRQHVKGIVVKAGPQGAPGLTGDFDNRFEGAWDSGTSYLTGDIVTHDGSSWLAIDPSTNVTPVEGADWTAIALAGEDGTDGAGVPAGGDADQVLVKLSSTDYDTAWVDPASSGGLLASTTYATANKSSTTTTLADIDAAGLAVTFTAPASGNVIIRLTGMHGHFGTNGDDLWGLRENTTTIVEGAVRKSGAWPANLVLSLAFRRTGLTPGNSYTYKWAWRTTAGTITLDVQYGGGHVNPPALMEVHSA